VRSATGLAVLGGFATYLWLLRSPIRAIARDRANLL
jgi:hypothetical protein